MVSSNKNIVSVNEKGRIYALKGGQPILKQRRKRKHINAKL